MNGKHCVTAILFDAMETIVDVTPIPDTRLRMAWLLERSDYARSVCDEDSLTSACDLARSQFDELVSQNREYTSRELFGLVADEIAGTDHTISRSELAADLTQSYEVGYFLHCTVASETEAVLSALSKEYSLGIVSNQIIEGGLQRYLQAREMHSLFDCIVTSADFGWREPAPEIYDLSARSLSVHPSQTLFVGDDITLDYETPISLGYRAMHYAPYRETGSETTLGSISELPSRVAPIERCG